MVSGQWPEWPFEWPPPGMPRVRRSAHPDLIAFLKKAIEPNPRKRFKDAAQMLAAFQKIKPKSLRYSKRRAA